MVQRRSFFKGYYEHQKKGFDRPLEKKEALCAVILKLLRVIFELMKDRRLFTEALDRCREAVSECKVVVEGGPCVFVGIEACVISLVNFHPPL